MLHSLLLTDDVETVDLFQRLVQTGPRELLLDEIVRPMVFGPQLHHILSTHILDVALLDVSDLEKAAAIFRQIRDGFPELAVVAFAQPGVDPPDIGDVPFLERPLTLEGILHTAKLTIQKLDHARYDNLYAFIPAKAGGGASTLALNTAGHLAHDFKEKVLVVESDLRSGVLSEILRVHVKVSTSELLQESDHLNAAHWDQCVVPTPGIDFILVGTKPSAQLPQWHDYRRLLAFTTQRYGQVLIDLPEAINDGTAEVVRKAKSVFIVVTPELSSLTLAKRRIEELQKAGADDKCIRILLNRWHPEGLQAVGVHETLGLPVAALFPNNYRVVTEAIVAGAFVPSEGVDGVLGQTFRAFAGSLLGKNEPLDVTKLAADGGVLKSVKRFWRNP
jgi:Flp pilus assembly CpaE family ATPase